MSLLIKAVEWNGKKVDIYIERNRIRKIGEDLFVQANRVINGEKKAVIPGMINCHTHAAMTLFRGYGDDMPLKPWLEERIWPNEAKLTEEDIYWGAKLACLEMIKTGTTTFFDMYYGFDATARAVEEMGLRAVLAGVCFDHFNPLLTEKCKRTNKALLASRGKYSDRIQYALGPHAVYTVSGELLQWVHAFAVEQDILIHLHLAETEKEVENAKEKFGCSPVQYLNRLGILSSRLVLAHGIYVDEEEIRLLAEHDVAVVHNPASNMKLGSGIEFKYAEMKEAGVRIGLGTDGCGSSNNLDMIEVMKQAALLGKGWRKDPLVLSAQEMFESATAIGASIMRVDAGRLEEGALADLALVDLRIPAFTPNFNFVSNLVYSANGNCVDTVICDGKILMENKKVTGEDEILERAAQQAYDLVSRSPKQE
ncbi:MAG: amidohydrolase [Massilibacteroides sp.]|nr:amidohydrolase [Massilibacteroides sp.]MDD3063085.1 amidohydrolase [Massilibacteroides sp.]MDD4116411.1 amidohydrolase [Massilibacteroides sp.]MDD4660523.1 amidohydrolase [Massilibacteroides sp.]